MNRDDLLEIETKLMKVVVTRRQLGAYNSEAETIMLLSEWLLEVVRHLREKAPRPRPKDDT